MPSSLIKILCTWLLFIGLVQAAESQFHITLLRAAPGELPTLIEQARQQKASRDNQLLILRHSQGDHWDLMLMQPLEESLPTRDDYSQWVDFQDDFIARAPLDWVQLANLSKGANLFHIEMFQAANKRYAELLEQRVMENNYLVATDRQANLIFETTFGSDVDLFTLGIYSDLQAFAAEPDLDSAVFEKAAVDAGFKSRSDIGFYLRRFLVGHQDTLATQIE
jgi:hypothetical protein